MIRLASLFTLFAAPLAAQAVDCTAPTVQQEMNYCAEQDWMQADTSLNGAYQQAISTLKETLADTPDDLEKEVTLLRDAQRAWIAFRDANCAVAGYPMRGGSAEPLLVYGCLRKMTLDRTLELGQVGQF